MKNIAYKIGLGILITLVCVLGVFVLKTKAEGDVNKQNIEYCAGLGISLDANSIYADFNQSTEDIMALYLKTANDYFNKNIKKMVAAGMSNAATGKFDKNASPPTPAADGNIEIDATTGISKACLSDDNFSTFCTADRFLNDKKFGYLAYRNSLRCRKAIVFDTQEAVENFKKYSDALIAGEKNEEQVAQVFQEQLILERGARASAIEREIEASKQALDATLSAYDQLKLTWPMHLRYMEIYKSLVKFRDKLVDIRHFVEDFPSKFIDATTTKCT